MTATDSPFDILGVAEDATPDEIRKAYRKQVLRWHPDRNPGDAVAAEVFLTITQAFQRLTTPDPDAGFDAERVAHEMQRAAEEAERRRRGVGIQGRAWQQARVDLDRPASEVTAERLRTVQGIVGIAVGVAVAILAVVFRAGVFDLIYRYLYAIPGGPWLVALVGVATGVWIGVHAVRTAEIPPYAVETHWRGLRDLRWDVMLAWSEIRGIKEEPGHLDVALTKTAYLRVARSVPAETFAAPGIYRFPMQDSSLIASIIRAKLAG